MLGCSSPRAAAPTRSQARQPRLDHCSAEAPACAGLLGRERAACRGVAAQQPLQRVRDLRRKGVRQPPGGTYQHVAVQAGVGRGDVALLPATRARTARRSRSASRASRPRRAPPGRAPRPPRGFGSPVVRGASCRLTSRFAARRRSPAALQVVRQLFECPAVEQLAQLLLPEQLAQQVAVQRQRRRPALRVGGVALVHVRAASSNSSEDATARRSRSRPPPRLAARRCSLPSSAVSPGRSSASRRHSRSASSTIGKSP